MLRIGVAALLICCAMPVVSAGPVDPHAPRARVPDLPSGAYVLAGSKVADLLGQCSRDTPETGEGSWRPDSATILALESALPSALARQRGDADWSGFPRRWARQYVGIVRGGRRYLYGNFGPPSALPHRPDKDAMMVCDGGARFFGAEYDVAAGKITHLAFNGVT